MIITFEQTQRDVLEVKQDVKDMKAFFLQKVETQNHTDDPQSIEQIEIFTGYGKATLYGYCQKNTIPHHKKNGRLFFFKSEIIDWIKQGKRKTITEVGVETDALLSKKRKSSK